VSKKFFIFSLIILLFCLGVFVGKYKFFPYSVFHQANLGFRKIIDEVGIGHSVWGYSPIPDDLKGKNSIFQSSQVEKGLNLITEMGPDKTLLAKVMDMEGKVLKQWNLDCFELWDNFDHIARDSRPKWRPGTVIHGAVLLSDGSLVFNHSDVGLSCIDKDDQLIWQLPYFTHHSVHLHDDSTLWVCGRKYLDQIDGFENDEPSKWAFSIIQLNLKGEILNEWLVNDWLEEGGYRGIIDLLTIPGEVPYDFHLNDVEPVPDSLTGPVFKAGDVLVSLRNVNTVFLYNIQDHEIRHMWVGQFVRQHDPDFLDSARISIFDNKNAAKPKGAGASRIVTFDLLNDSLVVAFEGNEQLCFVTSQGGKHQWLANGNLLLSETRRGRGIEVDNAGNLVWEYINFTGEDEIGFVMEVQRLSEHFNGMYAPVE